MDGAIQFLLAIAAVFGVLAVLSRYRNARRSAAVHTVAQQAGWTFEPGPMYSADLCIGRFPVFDRGRKRRASNVVRMRLGLAELKAFDYRYTTGMREQTHVTRQTTVHIRSPRLRLPQFVLIPKGVRQKIGELFGSGEGEIAFEESPDFSSRYVLRSNEAPYLVRNLFTSAVRAYFEQHSGVTLEAEGDQILAYRRDKLITPEELRSSIDELVSIAQLFER